MSPIYTNIALSVWVLFSFVASYYIIIAPSDEVIVLLDLAYLPKEFRYELALTTVVNFLLSYLFEIVLVKAFSEYWSKRNTHQKGYI
jgi:hypothetical protein